MAGDEGVILSTPAFDRVSAATKRVEASGQKLDALLRRRTPRGGGNIARYYKATSNWVNITGNGSFVQTNPSDDKLGTTIDETQTVNIDLPRNGSLEDPNIVEGAIIAAIQSVNGNWVCIGDYLDGTIAKSVQVWAGDPDDLAADKPGWDAWTVPQERFLAGYKCGSSLYGATGCTGGFTWHGLTENNHDDHCLAHTHCVTTGVNCVDVNLDNLIVARFDSTDSGVANWTNLNDDHNGPYNGASDQDTDNRPPWATVFWIIRADNADAA